MLIGGPNQSHKVNFKEPAPLRGKISKKTFRFSAVNTFPEFFRKKCWEGTPVFSFRCISPAMRREVLTEGTAENANPLSWFKNFLLGLFNQFTKHYHAMISDILFLDQVTRFINPSRANAVRTRTPLCVSITLILNATIEQKTSISDNHPPTLTRDPLQQQ